MKTRVLALFVLFAALHQDRAAETLRDDPENLPEYFTCPDEHWRKAKFDGSVHCYRPLKYTPTKGYTKDMNLLANDYCKTLGTDVHIASIHSQQELHFISDTFTNYLDTGDYCHRPVVTLFTGLYLPSGLPYKADNFVNVDGTHLNFAHFVKPDELSTYANYTRNGTLIAVKDKSFWVVIDFNKVIDQETTAFLCKTPATKLPQFLPTTPDPNRELVCPAGWTKAHVCGGTNCYKRIDTPPTGVFDMDPAEYDECAELYPGSSLASINCKEEDEFLHRFDQSIIGFHAPQYVKNPTTDQYRWSDSSTVSYINFYEKPDLYRWHSLKHRVYPNFVLHNQTHDVFGAWQLHSGQGKESRPPRLCELKGAKDASLFFDEVLVKYPRDNDKCISFGNTPNRTQCPDSSWLKIDLNGVATCFKAVQFDDVNKYLDNSICQKIHKEAHAVSISNSAELDLLDYYFSGAAIGLTVDGKGAFSWSDGSKTGYIRWADESLANGSFPVSVVTHKDSACNARYNHSFSLLRATDQKAGFGVCKMTAFRLTPCLLNLPGNDEVHNPDSFQCAQGWTKFKACNVVSCYKAVDWPQDKGVKISPRQVLQGNYCSSKNGSAAASVVDVHCDREDRFIRNTFGKVLLGLKYNGSNRADAWSWTAKDAQVDYMAPTFGYPRDLVFEQGIEAAFPVLSQTIDFDGKVFTTVVPGQVGWTAASGDETLEDAQLLCKTPATKTPGLKSADVGSSYDDYEFVEESAPESMFISAKSEQ